MNSRAIIEACRPYEWISKFPPVVGATKELLGEVQKKWGRCSSLKREIGRGFPVGLHAREVGMATGFLSADSAAAAKPGFFKSYKAVILFIGAIVVALIVSRCP